MALSTEKAPAGQLKRPHLHLVWKPAGQPNASWKWQLFGYYWRETPKRLNLVFSLRGMLLWSASLSFAAYLIGAAVLVTLWSRNPYNQVGYLDVVLPTRWSDLRALRGKALIAEGIADIKAKRYATGIMRLTQGVARNPKDFTGRLELARIYVALGQLHRAQNFLTEGLREDAPPGVYIDALLQLTAYMEDFEGILTLISRLEHHTDPAIRRQILMWHGRALERLGRVNELDSLRNRLRATLPSVSVEAAWARAQLVAGKPAVALAEVRQDRIRFGTPSEVAELELRLAAAARDTSAVDEAVERWLFLAPSDHVPRAWEIAARIALGDKELPRELTRQYLAVFGGTPAAIHALIDVLARESGAQWAMSAYGEIQTVASVPVQTRMTLVEALINEGEFGAAQYEFARTKAAIAAEKFADREWSTVTDRLLNCVTAPTPSATNQLTDLFASRRMSPNAFRFAWRALLAAKSPALHAFSTIANNRFPALRFGESDSERQALASIPPPALDFQSSKPSREMTSAPAPATLSDEPARVFPTATHAQNALQNVDSLIQGQQLDNAMELLQRIERAQYESLRGECAFRRVEIHGTRGELFELTSALRIYLRSPSVNQTTIRNLAAKWDAKALRDSELTLLRETVRQFPAASWAAEMLKHAQARLVLAPAENIVSPQK